MNIQLVKKNNVDQDMLSYEKNLRQHKLKTAGMVVAGIAIIGLCLYGIKISLDHRSYTTCEVVRSFDRADTITTKHRVSLLCDQIQQGWNLLRGFRK